MSANHHPTNHCSTLVSSSSLCLFLYRQWEKSHSICHYFSQIHHQTIYSCVYNEYLNTFSWILYFEKIHLPNNHLMCGARRFLDLNPITKHALGFVGFHSSTWNPTLLSILLNMFLVFTFSLSYVWIENWSQNLINIFVKCFIWIVFEQFKNFRVGFLARISREKILALNPV